MDNSILEVDSIQKKYGYKTILSDVYLKCKTSEIIGVLGRNGSGKSTLFKIIYSLEQADYKFVRVDGVLKNETSKLLNDISYLPQNRFIPIHLTVKNTIKLAIDSKNFESFYNDEMIQSIQNRKINQLSTGELRYLEIKLLLFNNAKFLLLDEPFSGLSPILIEKINTLILENKSRKGILITDHSYENIIKIATKLVLLKDGKTYSLKDKFDLVDKGYLKEGMI